MMILSIIEFFVSIFVNIYQFGEDFIKLEYDDFRVLQQLLIPALTGGIGGLSLMVMASLSNYDEFSFKDFYKVYIKLALLGGIAGVAAVNLLNPGGDISQVMVLGLIAGLSGFSYLKRNSLVDSIHEDALLKGIKKSVVNEAEKFLGEVEIEEEVENNVLSFDELDSSDVEKYTDKKVGEWVKENPDATDEDLYNYVQEVIAAVIANPELVKSEE